MKLLNYLIMFIKNNKIYILLSFVQAILLKYNPLNLLENSPYFKNILILINIFYIIIKLLLSRYLGISNLGNEPLKVLNIILYVLIVFIVLIFIFTKINVLYKIFKFIKLITLITIILGIFYILKNNNGNITNFINTLINNVINQYYVTEPIIKVIFLIELIILFFMYLFPYIFDKYLSKGGIHILKKNVYLNNKKVFNNYELEKNEMNYKYSLLFSIWINPQPSNTNGSYSKYTNLLNYGNKPIIEYNGDKQIFRIRTDTGNNNIKTIYETKNFNYQKWNNIVINYDGGNMDVFINDTLVASEMNIAPYIKNDKLITGETNGIHGGINNIIYFDRILLKNEIMNMNKLMK